MPIYPHLQTVVLIHHLQKVLEGGGTVGGSAVGGGEAVRRLVGQLAVMGACLDGVGSCWSAALGRGKGRGDGAGGDV